MITGKSIAAGDVIRMPKLSEEKEFRVTEVKDGIVTVTRNHGHWWLNYQQVRDDGVMVRRAAKPEARE